MSQENVERVRRSLNAWNRGDFDAWGVDAHPEIEYSLAITRQSKGDETVWQGPEEMLRYWDEWHSLWTLRIEVSEIRDLGDTVVALGRIEKASGVKLKSPVAYVYEFDKSLFRRVRAYLDPSEALKAVGLEE